LKTKQLPSTAACVGVSNIVCFVCLDSKLGLKRLVFPRKIITLLRGKYRSSAWNHRVCYKFSEDKIAWCSK